MIVSRINVRKSSYQNGRWPGLDIAAAVAGALDIAAAVAAMLGFAMLAPASIAAQRTPDADSAAALPPATVDRDSIASLSRTAAAVLDAAAQSLRLAPHAPAEIWPGFRPDTLAVLLSVPEVGWLMTGWEGDPPEGFTSIAGIPGASWRGYRPDAGEDANAISPQGRPWISYGASGARAPDLGNLVHEAFHLFQRAHRPAGLYPAGENSFRVVSYPEFDAVNEAGHALEGRLLDDALRALPDTSTAASRVREFLAVRERRQRRMQPEDALFEIRTELNEGVAQYGYVRALQLTVERGGSGDTEGWATDARAEIATQRSVLADLIAGRRQSVRLRFYATGFAQALLLDALAGPSWKARVMEDGTALQDLLADASGYRIPERALAADARARHADLATAGEEAVHERLADRRRRAEDALAETGVRIDIDAGRTPGGIGYCGIDPQNLLQVDEQRLLHGRWFRPCAEGLQADLNARIVHDRAAQTLAFVVPAEGLTLTLDGAPVDLPPEGRVEERTGSITIESEGVSIRAQHARLRVEPGRVGVVLMPVE